MKIKCVLLVLLFWASHESAAQLYVPLNHWVYDFLDRMQTRGLVQNERTVHRPCTRETVSKMLAEMDKRLTEGKYRLSEAENRRFQQLKGEFADAIPWDKPQENNFAERHLYSWQDRDNSAHIDGYFEQALDYKTGDSYAEDVKKSRTTAGFTLRGKIKKNFGFYLFAKNTLIKGESLTERFDPSLGMPVTVSGQNAYSDDATAYISWKLPWFQLTFGRKQVQWGPGYNGSLMLSRTNPNFTLLNVSAELGQVQFIYVHGKLHTGIGNKFLAAHRIEVQPFKWWVIGAGESVVYGGGFEPAYFNPLMPFHVAEHHLGDEDNNTLGFDFTFYPLWNHKAYLEVFIDDMTTSRDLFSYYGNKFAFLAGWQWTQPLGWADGDIRVEYTRIESYVYTHDDSINVYTNYDQCIGHWLGPNADHLFFKIGWWLNGNLSLDFLVERIRRGEGDLFTPHKYGTGENKDFLGGTVESRWLIGGKLCIQLFRDAFLSMQLQSSAIRNAGLLPDKKARNLVGFLVFQMDY